MVYVKYFDILGIDTAQIPCIELQGVPNAATVGAVGLLGMDVTSEGREIYVCTAVNGAVYTWQPLKDGKDGTCVVKAEINANRELILTLSDGKTLNAGVVKGDTGKDGVDGKDGKDGVSVTNARIVDGILIFTLSDGTERYLGKVTGENGVSVIKAEVNAKYELVLTLSNDTVLNLGSVKSDTAKHVEAEEGYVSSYRHVWFSDNMAETQRAYDDDFQYNPNTNTLKIGDAELGRSVVRTFNREGTSITINNDGDSPIVTFSGFRSTDFEAGDVIRVFYEHEGDMGAFDMMLMTSGSSAAYIRPWWGGYSMGGYACPMGGGITGSDQTGYTLEFHDWCRRILDQDYLPDLVYIHEQLVNSCPIITKVQYIKSSTL